MTQSALILIDIQNDYFPEFADCRMPLQQMSVAAANAAKLLDKARERGTNVIHIRHIAGSDKAPFFRPGSDGSQIHKTVFPKDNETIIKKSRPNSFLGTDLDAGLKRRGVTHLIVCGAMSQMCVDATARAAVDLGYTVTVVHDACAAAGASHDGIVVRPEMVHASIIAPLAASYATVIGTEHCIEAPWDPEV